MLAMVLARLHLRKRLRQLAEAELPEPAGHGVTALDVHQLDAVHAPFFFALPPLGVRTSTSAPSERSIGESNVFLRETLLGLQQASSALTRSALLPPEMSDELFLSTVFRGVAAPHGTET